VSGRREAVERFSVAAERHPRVRGEHVNDLQTYQRQAAISPTSPETDTRTIGPKRTKNSPTTKKL
jgi:hypothetical protein